MLRLPFAILSLCIGLLGTATGAPNKKPETGGLDTEPGLGLRIYWIGDHFDEPGEPVAIDPSASANVDLTVPSVEVEADTVFQNDQQIMERDKEKIRSQYIAEWSGWIRIPMEGAYSFALNTTAPTRFMIGGERVGSDTKIIPRGWHTFELIQIVKNKADKPIRLAWKTPRRPRQPAAVPTGNLLAPKYYFRPTQSGQKALSGKKTRPGLGKKLDAVHPGYRATNIRPGNLEMPVGGLGMLSDGRLAVARFDAQTLKGPHPTKKPNGELWLISNPGSDDPSEITGEKIADELFEPSGLKVLDDAIYVSQRNELSCYSYDPMIDQWQKTVVAKGWTTNDFHQISAGLPWTPGPTPGHPGYLYMSRGSGLGLWQNPPNHGAVWKIDLSQAVGENIEVLAGGLRTPNGLGLNAEGECFVIDNQGNWTPANEINHVQKGRFFGFYQPNRPPKAHPSPFQPKEHGSKAGVTEAAIKLPQDEIANSPTQLLLFPDGHQFEGQFAVGDMRYGGINRAYLEKVNGVYQGCIMRFTQGLAAGPNRILFGPDGSLYVGGIGGRHARTWYWKDPKKNNQPIYQGLERLTPTGETAFEIHHMSATPDGFVIHFTEAVPKETLENPAAYALEQWTYRATRHYGGPKIDQEELSVTRAIASEDGRSVRLTVPGRKQGYVIHLRTDPIASSGRAIWSGDVWYTLNEIPE
ncbi:hypothetical protein DDZ13_09410 [Coraliomargarita sinensis]|uniref:PA14 domain-containing protein n=2 Tax=Coraliomargarita sinensis TaxID=2174842 RepID=A0A317ZEY5_9BACT|nr:hypothetical protein DDZ13_09410 [Coraliomargarita sinensis]